ncbi:branched-chain amino acid ABC transporter permease [Bradyrhizobium sp. CSA207]|uniref:branched-chain amino acid ABC transporter permease n=1 Tax=Bradyrhizobium sp. CSA207 TaxID=2698826 RepID=UPI0023B157D8|nr:branched-chain amino acid ABC transporter permease [Bradyrhizobium sp. CSA207]MDE5444343.1 branched-chain amino acid ABC transporter permease [Bradyrhizobium sp. CSA207]
MDWDVIPQFLAGGLAIGAVYGLIGVGFSLIYNTSKVINFAQGEFVVYGGLATVSLTAASLPTAVAIPLSLAASVVLGGALQSLLSTARRGSNELTYIMTTIGVAIAMQGLAQHIWGTDFKTFALYSDGTIRLMGATVNYGTITTLLATSTVCALLWVFLYRTMIGKAMRACANDSRAAQTIGIRPRRMVLLAYVASAGIGGLAGILITPSQMMSYDNGVPLAIKGFTAAIVGGLANPFGAVVGGVVLGLLEGLGVGLISSDLQNAYAFLSLLVILLVRPQGLFGRAAAGSAR